MHRFNWIEVHAINNAKKKLRLGIRKELTSKLDTALNRKPIYIGDVNSIKNNTRFVEFFSEKKMLMDENLKVYGFTTIGDSEKTYCYIIYPVKCVKCKKLVTYAEGMLICERCNNVKGEYI